MDIKPAPVDNDSWITYGLDACRLLAKDDGRIMAPYFALEMGIVAAEADRRLRHLSKMGVLRMSTDRVDGEFVRYVWHMVDQAIENPRR